MPKPALKPDIAGLFAALGEPTRLRLVDRLSDGSHVYTVDVLNTQTTFQLNRYISFRGIVQYDSSRARILTDLLASWELLPGTVAYAGYGSLIEKREWDGQLWTPGAGTYRTSQRGLFFKAAYVHRF